MQKKSGIVHSSLSLVQSNCHLGSNILEEEKETCEDEKISNHKNIIETLCFLLIVSLSFSEAKKECESYLTHTGRNAIMIL